MNCQRCNEPLDYPVVIEDPSPLGAPTRWHRVCYIEEYMEPGNLAALVEQSEPVDAGWSALKFLFAFREWRETEPVELHARPVVLMGQPCEPD